MSSAASSESKRASGPGGHPFPKEQSAWLQSVLGDVFDVFGDHVDKRFQAVDEKIAIQEETINNQGQEQGGKGAGQKEKVNDAGRFGRQASGSSGGSNGSIEAPGEARGMKGRGSKVPIAGNDPVSVLLNEFPQFP